MDSPVERQLADSPQSMGIPASPPPSCTTLNPNSRHKGSRERGDSPAEPDEDHMPPEQETETPPEPTVSGANSSGRKGRRRRKGLELLWHKLDPAWTLENSGSVARDHLASERTFLAYVRTSLAIASTGVALVQLFTIAGASNAALARYSRPLGATIVIIGLCVLFLGVARYFTVQYALVKGMFPVARVSSVLVALALCAIITAVFGILVGNRG